jgi:hypothetical protein
VTGRGDPAVRRRIVAQVDTLAELLGIDSESIFFSTEGAGQLVLSAQVAELVITKLREVT